MRIILRIKEKRKSFAGGRRVAFVSPPLLAVATDRAV